MPASPATRILIIDDAASLRAVLRTLLGNNGYQVVGELADGTRALEAVERLRPEIVCLDMHMPKVDGMTVLTELHARQPGLAVVMMTADTDPDLHHRATRAGVAGFLNKPFSAEQILSELRQVDAAVRLLQRVATNDTVPDFDLGRPRAVIADDSAALRRLLRAILEDAGIEVIAEAHDGQEAIATVTQDPPDLLCMDVEMPVLDGIAALGEIHARLPSLPVLMVTSRADRATVQQAARHGARGYILKPYQPDKVAVAVRTLLKL